MILIPTISTGDLYEYSFGATLDGTIYTLKLSWNERMDHWFLSMYTVDDEIVIEGVMVINGVDLLRSCVETARPPGQLFAVPTDRRQAHAGIDGLGSRVQLYYRPEAEL